MYIQTLTGTFGISSGNCLVQRWEMNHPQTLPNTDFPFPSVCLGSILIFEGVPSGKLR